MNGAPTSQGHPDRWRILAVLCAVLMLVVIDATVLHVAAPSIATDLDPTSVQLLWIIDMYSLVVAALLVPAATLADRIGRRHMLWAGMVVFGVASVLAAFAPSASLLIAARAALGVGGAMILPTTMSIVRDVFEDRAERVKAVGIWSGVLGVGAAIGPLVGGFVVEHWWWGAVFLINVPVILGALPFVFRVLPLSRSAHPAPWDWASVGLSVATLLGVAFGIKHAARYGLAEPTTVVPLALGVAAGYAFARRQLTMPDPLLDVRLFVSPVFSIAVGAVVLTMFGLFALEYLFAQYLQLVLGLEPLAAALRLVPLMLATFAGSLAAAAILRRFATRRTISLSLLAAAVSLLPLLRLGLHEDFALFAVSSVAFGFALSVALVAANDVIVSAVSADRAGNASAIEETAYELGGGLGIAVLGSLATVVYRDSLSHLPGLSAGQREAASESLSGATEVALSLPSAFADQMMLVARGAFVDGLQFVLLFAAVLTAAGALAAARIIRA